MVKNDNGIEVTCPKCDKSFVLDKALSQAMEGRLKKELEKKYCDINTKLKIEMAGKVKTIESLKKSVESEVEQALKEERKKIELENKKQIKLIEEKAKEQAKENVSKEIKDLSDRLKERDEQVAKANENELILRRDKRKLEDDKKNFELEIERKMEEERKKIQEATQKQIDEHYQLKMAEKDKQLTDLNVQLSEMKRKTEQGSQQLQGESFQETIENVIRDEFNLDEITPIATGVKGADILQSVRLLNGKNCGSILIETKNAKNWSTAWITKIKNDMLDKKADLGIIVTTVLPENARTFETINGIVVVQYTFVIPVIAMLRDRLIELTKVKEHNIGKNEKLEALYSYLTSSEFRQRMGFVIDSFISMQKDLETEKRVMTKHWAQREKQIQRAASGITTIYGSMQGMLGSSMGPVKKLELSSLTEEDEEKKNKVEDSK